ncbi:MAG TPA: class II aldolase/adducin family protein [Candidatus Fermentibacter daniensis]|nr:class II aldolase/adducin family protein [Candidatus Fermentibacter daniensis]HOG54633.1 class II aldolase/adducin family protein [Candidatus Fermentibacter daniensis]
MRKLLSKYADKLARTGLAVPGSILFGGRDDSVEWVGDDSSRPILEEVFERLAVGSLLLFQPSEPWSSMIGLLAPESGGAIRPSDCENRTFLHEIPVAPRLEAGILAGLLGRRRSAVVPGPRIAAWGSVSPEQAFVSASSVCFSCFVKFMADYLDALETGRRPPEAWRRVVEAVRRGAGAAPFGAGGRGALSAGPFRSEAAVRSAIAEVGARTVESGLVDSYFGNVSWLLDGVLYISQTASSLDELAGATDACPLDGSSCTPITASSEYMAHVEALRATGADGILHGHPRFAVISSLACGRPSCGGRGSCHIRCPHARRAGGAPIVSGEIGAGPTGLYRTLPSALAGSDAAIVHGHGVFSVARGDFRGAFDALSGVEQACRAEYFERIDRIDRGG